jgi:glycosyltransferase involved in cell wall biosynthesis
MRPASASSPSPVRTAAIIPARNEANTVGGVVYAALDARLVDEVIVVDNGSTDGTGTVAASHGARVVEAPAPGKGEAMMAGVAATGADVIVFLDADLVVLRPHHVDSLVELVRNGQADMACGLFDRGPVKNPFFLAGLPVLTGQRALHRGLFEQLEPKDIRGYRVEAALNMLVMGNDLVRVNRVLPGLWHRTKQEKLSNPLVGYARKVIMLASACWNYVRFAVRKPKTDVKIAR